MLAKANELLAEIVTFKEADNSVGCIFQSFGDAFFPDDFAIFDQRSHLLDELVLIANMVADNETLHADSFADDLNEISRCAGWLGRIVRRDHAAFDAATKVIHHFDRSFQVVTAHAVEIDVDPIRSVLGEFAGKIVGLFVVDDCVNPYLDKSLKF